MIAPCPYCNSTRLKTVFYCNATMLDPDLWTWDYTGYLPSYTLKRIECAECGATSTDLAASNEDAINNWNKNVNNHRNVLFRLREFPIHATIETESVT